MIDMMYDANDMYMMYNAIMIILVVMITIIITIIITVAVI